MDIWQTIPRPFFILAPMEDVTDTVFRQIIAEIGRPNLFFTEFTNVDGMFSRGESEVTKRLVFSKIEKPLIAQIWGITPENYYKAAKEIVDMGFEGIDINMGCPQEDVIKKGACSALMNNHPLTKEIIQATREGARKLPVSIKTRIGFKTVEIEEWLGFLLEQKLPALTVHLRTVREMSKVPAHWELMPDIVRLRNEIHKDTLLIGNGDVESLIDAKEKVTQTGIDGVMIGRGIFHNPWLFNEKIDIQSITLQDRLTLLSKHVALYEKIWQGKKPYQILKKYFKIYLSGFEGANEMRQEFMLTNTPEEAKELAARFASDNK